MKPQILKVPFGNNAVSSMHGIVSECSFNSFFQCTNQQRETARFASFSNQAYPVDHALYATTLFQSLMPHIGNRMMITDRFTNQFTDSTAA